MKGLGKLRLSGAGEDMKLMAVAQRNPGTAAVLSFLIPGLGQFYNGDFLRGIFWLIVTPGLWIGSGGTLGWICHILAAITAHRRAVLKQGWSS